MSMAHGQEQQRHGSGHGQAAQVPQPWHRLHTNKGRMAAWLAPGSSPPRMLRSARGRPAASPLLVLRWHACR